MLEQICRIVDASILTYDLHLRRRDFGQPPNAALHSRHVCLGEPIRAHSKKSLHFKRCTEHIVQSDRQITSIGQRPLFWAAHAHARRLPEITFCADNASFFSMLSLKARKHRRRMERFPIQICPIAICFGRQGIA